MLEDKKILVTGASGFVGTNLIKKLVELGYRNIIACYRDKSPQVEFDFIDYRYGDLTEKHWCEVSVQGADVVVMCAAHTSGAAVMEKTPLAHVTPNVLMNTNMLEAAYKEGVKKFIFISTNTVYPAVDYPVKEEDATGEFFHKYYCVANMKWFSEILCKMYGEKIKNPMTTIIVRPGNLYGPYDDFEWETSHVVPAMIRRVVERHDPIEIWGDGKDIKDLLYIDDFVDGVVNVLENVENHDVFNLAKGQGVCLRDVLNVIIELDKYENPVINYDETKPTMIPKRLINIEKAKDLLGFNPKTGLWGGLEKTIQWYREKINGHREKVAT